MEEGSRSPSAVRSGFLHELSIAESVVRIASRQADGRQVIKVQMKVGYLRQVVPSALSFGFGLLAEGTPVEGAEPQYQAPADWMAMQRFKMPKSEQALPAAATPTAVVDGQGADPIQPYDTPDVDTAELGRADAARDAQ